MLKEIKNWTIDKWTRFKKWIVVIVFGTALIATASEIILPDKILDISTEKVLEKYNASTEIKDKYQLDGASLKRTVKDNPKDMVRVEIGDKNAEEFIPKLKISRWDEVDFTLTPKDFDKIESKDKTLKFDKEKIKVETPKIDYHLYELPISEDLLEGGFEYEIILLEKPDTNVITFNIETEGLDFFYQPELTQEEKDRGDIRPENIIGSYVVYTSEEKINYVGGKEYETGKMGQFYYPYLIDANGWKIRAGDFKITLNEEKIKGLLTVTIPQDFLDNAIYPIKHATGLTFGYESAGETSEYIAANSITGSFFTSTAAGTIDSISISLERALDGDEIKGAIYSGGYGNDLTKVTNSVTPAGTLPATKDWLVLSYSTKPSVSISTSYFLGGVSETDNDLFYYDAGTTNQGIDYYDCSYSSPDTTLTYSGGYENYGSARKYSIYATYTADTPSDTCTYGGTGNWNVLESDNCYIGSDVYVNGDLNLIGSTTGKFYCNAQISATGYNFGSDKNTLDLGTSCKLSHH